jgi:hypothetical protein
VVRAELCLGARALAASVRVLWLCAARARRRHRRVAPEAAAVPPVHSRRRQVLHRGARPRHPRRRLGGLHAGGAHNGHSVRGAQPQRPQRAGAGAGAGAGAHLSARLAACDHFGREASIEHVVGRCQHARERLRAHVRACLDQVLEPRPDPPVQRVPERLCPKVVRGCSIHHHRHRRHHHHHHRHHCHQARSLQPATLVESTRCRQRDGAMRARRRDAKPDARLHR